ncbi:MAG: RecB family exonuclease [Alphaproteobacteria bacterium]
MNTREQDIVMIRASSLAGYSDCPRRAAGRIFPDAVNGAGYTLRPLPASIAAAVGTAVHKAAERILREKAASGVTPSEAEAAETAVSTLHERAALGLLYDRDTPTLGDAERQVQRMAAVYHRDVAPEVTPVLVEERLESEIAPGVILSGQMDVIAGAPNRVRDLKTGKSPAAARAQLGAYALLARAHGLEITGVMIDFIRRVPCRLPQPGVLSFTYDPAECENAAIAVARNIASDLRSFRLGDPKAGLLPGDPWAFPANPNSKLCGDKWCGAFGTVFCREHATQQIV